jgi:hypothetical protein
MVKGDPRVTAMYDEIGCMHAAHHGFPTLN